MAGGQQPGRGRGRRDLKAPLVPGNGPLARVPAAAVFGLVLVLFVVGVVVRGPLGAGLLGALVLLVLGLLGATWRTLSTADRVGRVVVLAILVAVLVSVLR
jgi:energy-coupling factor transporter transmembrane protein EcfT